MAVRPSPTPQFRLKFDVPHDFAVEPGFMRDQHCHDMRTDDKARINTWRCPVTGLISLIPSFLTEEWEQATNWRLLTEWRRSATFWEPLYGGFNNDAARLFSTVVPANPHAIDMFITTATAVKSIDSTIVLDELVPMLESEFELAPDEGFVLTYFTMGPELRNHRNWFAFALDDLYVHFSFDGVIRVFDYANGTAEEPVYREEFEIASPGEIVNKQGYFVFRPIPGHGLAVYHSLSAQRMDAKNSSAAAGVVRGHLIKRKRGNAEDGYSVHSGGKMTLFFAVALLSSKVAYAFGYHQLTYPTGENIGAYYDNIFDPGYKPVNAPATVQSVVIPAAYGSFSASAVLRKADDSGNWTAGTDRQGRIKMSLSNTDAKYSPFLMSSYVVWPPVMETRDTTPLTPDELWRLEWSEDDQGRVEGVAQTMMKSTANRALCERGDTTWQIEVSEDEGDTWDIVCGGLASLAGPVRVVIDEGGVYYLANWKLAGMEARFAEASHVLKGTFDGLPIGEAINKVLTSCGFPFIDPLPTEATTVKLPQMVEGQNFRWAPRLGQSGDDILRELLILLRRQFVEYRLRYDWENAEWKLEQKPRDTSSGATWQLTPFQDEADLATRKVWMGSNGDNTLFTFNVFPPEANIIQPYGCNKPDADGDLVPGTPLVNGPSLTDETSVDYLGRAKVAYPLFAPVDNKQTINAMGRRVFAAACHRRLQPSVIGRDWVKDFKPGVYVNKIRGLNASGARADLLTGLWLKRRTTVLEYNDGPGEVAPLVTYGLDTVWESEMTR